MAGKIPVIVISGFLGSGKTTLLNRLLASARAAGQAEVQDRTVVLVNELGAVSLDHERYMSLGSRLVLLESGCICCAVHGDLVDTLRQLFLDALHRKIPPFSMLLIETTGMADPAPVMHTLQYDRFLADRYRYAGCLTVVDGEHGTGQLQQHPEALQQVALADVLAISKSDQVGPAHLSVLRQALQGLNPAAPVCLTQDLPGLDAMPAMLAEHAWRKPVRFGASLWSGSTMSQRKTAHAGVGVLIVKWDKCWVRSASMRALPELLGRLGTGLLRLKGRVFFNGDSHASVLHAVHQHLYPIEAVESSLPGEPGFDKDPLSGASVLLFIYRDLEESRLLELVHDLLPGGMKILSPDGNFIQ